MKQYQHVFMVVSIVVGCSGPVPSTLPPYELWDESGEELRRLPSVPRLHLRATRPLSVQDIWLIRGEVSTATSNKLATRDIPDSLSSKREPLSVWTTGDEVILAPGVPLQGGGVYTLVVLGSGTLAELRITDEPTEVWSRWGNGAVRAGASLAYCRMKTLPYVEFEDQGISGSEPATSDGGAAGAAAVAMELALPDGTFRDQCLTFSAVEIAAGVFIPPARGGAITFDPAPVWLDTADPPAEGAALPKVAPVEFFEGCVGNPAVAVCPVGAGLQIMASNYDIALEIRRGEVLVGRLALPASADALRVGPVEPDTEYRFRGVVFESSDVRRFESWSAVLTTGPRRPQFVITEVMADPAGPEPQAEWVEIQNVGTAAGSLEGFEIGDDAGWSLLPSAELLPGQFGLVVSRDFAPSGGHVPASTAVPLLVDSLGHNGLRNSGEQVQLRAPDGAIHSTVVGKKTSESVSLARISAWSSDSPDAFQEHGEPGASPGRANAFASDVTGP